MPATLRRHLGLASATGICIASMIGSGIFAITGLIGPALGSGFNLILVWVLGGLLSLAGAFTVAELAANRPTAGALFVAARETLGPRLGFVNGIVTVLIGYVAAIAFISLIVGAYLEEFLPGIPANISATAIMVLLTFLHSRFMRSGARLNDAMTILKVLLIALFAAAGLLVSAPENATLVTTTIETPSVWSATIGAAVVSISFAYLGWSAAADVAGEVRNPGRTLPLAILGSVGVVTVLYVLVNLAYLRALPPAAMVNAQTGEPIADIGAVAARILFGSAAGSWISLAIIVVLVSTLSTMIFTGGRVLTSMAVEAELPRTLANRNRFGAPTLALLVQATLCVPFIWIPTLGGLLEYIGLLITMCASMSGFAVLIRRRRREIRVWSMPLHPLPVTVFLVLSGWLAVSAIIDSPMTALASAGTLLAILAARPLIRYRVAHHDARR
jgi:APA family basic amino acid/polyamine antiporter